MSLIFLEVTMLDGIKKRLIHFESDGKSVVSDFVSARQRRAGALRRVVHACFYIQCAAALVCVACGFAMGGAFTGLALTIGAAATVAAALMAVAGEPVIRVVSCALDVVYALICFIVSGNGTVFLICGLAMLAAAIAAGVSFAAGYFRDWLLEYPAAKINKSDYTLTGELIKQAVPETDAMPAAEPVQELPPQPSELMLIAEKVSSIMNSRNQSAQKNTTEVHTGESTQG